MLFLSCFAFLDSFFLAGVCKVCMFTETTGQFGFRAFRRGGLPSRKNTAQLFLPILGLLTSVANAVCNSVVSNIVFRWFGTLAENGPRLFRPGWAS
jgi:hypothetical protein